MQDGRTWWKESPGLAGSLLLHLALMALWLFWSLGHPVPPSAPLKTMLVDLVAAPDVAPGKAGGAPVAEKRPQVATAPRRLGEKPKAVTPLPDEMEARIAALSNLREASSPLPTPDNDGPAAGSGSGGGYALADFVRAQILRKWWPDLGSDAARGTPVAIRLTLSRAGVISDIHIVDQQRFANDKLFRGMALSARNAAILASPIPLPPGHYDAVMQVAITLDPKAVLH